MSERKVNLEEILNDCVYIDDEIKPMVKTAMREACRQVLELAAENARLTEKMSIPEDDLESIDVTTREAPDMTYIVGKQSILDTINQIE